EARRGCDYPAGDSGSGGERTLPRRLESTAAIYASGAATTLMTAGDRGLPRSPSALLPPLGLWPEDSDALEAYLFVQRRALNPDVVMGRSRGVRRQRFWDNGLGKLREALAHQYCDFRRPAAGAASDGWRWSVV